MSFNLTAQATRIPVEADQLMIGSHRIEAQLQALAIQTQFPAAVLSSAITAFEQRVATRGIATTD